MNKYEENVLCMTKHKIFELLERLNKERSWSCNDAYKIKAVTTAYYHILAIEKAMKEAH